MDVFVFPTHREGLGKVLLEAADAGKPVISTFTTGVVDVVQNGVTGLLVPPRDAEALANAVSALLNDRAMAARMGTAARQLVRRHFDNTIYLERRLTLLDSLLRGGVPANPVQDGEEHCVLSMHP
jgi:glycosyltransferase involved in cell wall biosynthesis